MHFYLHYSQITPVNTYNLLKHLALGWCYVITCVVAITIYNKHRITSFISPYSNLMFKQ